MKVIFMYYIQETDKPHILMKLFNIIQVRENKILLPIDGNQQMKRKKAQKLAKKTKKIFEKAKSKKIVISQKIQEQEDYMNLLYSYSLEIVEGKWLWEVLSCEVLDFILEKKQMKKQETAIAILVNDLSENMLENLKKIAKEYKTVSILTNHREKFKKLEKQILEEEGIILTVGNNKKKGLARVGLILNVDFPNELINQYQIYEKAILVNLRGNVKITKKRFEGMTINDYEIELPREEEFDYEKISKYKTCQVYEAQFNKRQPFEKIKKQLEKDKVKIKELIGVNSVITS